MHTFRGEDVTLQCALDEDSSSNDQNANFRWLRQGEPLLDACTTGNHQGTGKYISHRGNRSCNLTLRHVELADEGSYRCEVNGSSIVQWDDSYLSVLGIQLHLLSLFPRHLVLPLSPSSPPVFLHSILFRSLES